MNGHIGILRIRHIRDDQTLIRYITRAFEFNQPLCVKYLLSKPLLAIEDNPDTWLQYAASNGNLRLFKLVRSRWPNTNLNHALSDAIGGGKFKMVKYLISLGADPFNEDEDIDLDTLVVESGNLPLVKYLIRLGLVFDRENENTLATAVSTGNLDLVKFLITDLKFKLNYSALNEALYYSRLDIAKYLIDSGIQIKNNAIEYINFNGEKFLTETLPFILSNKTFETSHLTNALDKVLSYKRYDVVDLLIQHGANLMNIDKTFLTMHPLERVIFLVQHEPSLAQFVTPNILNKLRDKGYTDIANLVVSYRK
jgi:ankyrin repeat protein